MKPREAQKLIRKAGWLQDKNLGKGSHRVYRHREKPGIITIPWHSMDIPAGTLRNILKVAGLD